MWNVALNPYQIQALYNGANETIELTGTSATSGQVRLTWGGISTISAVSDYVVQYKFST